MRSTTIAAILLLASASVQGCKGCGRAPPTAASASVGRAPDTPAATVSPEPPPVPSPGRLTATTEVDAGPYTGPSSRSADGFVLASGFADEQGGNLSQPNALELGHAYVSILDPKNRPVGHLGKLAGADVHGFLVARDMRQALYARAGAPIAPGSDARDLRFRPREGGAHALIVAFADADGRAHTISTPVVVKGALPEVQGVGVAGLGSGARVPGGDWILTTDPPEPVAGRMLRLLTTAVDNTGKRKGAGPDGFVLVYNDDPLAKRSENPKTADLDRVSA